MENKKTTSDNIKKTFDTNRINKIMYGNGLPKKNTLKDMLINIKNLILKPFLFLESLIKTLINDKKNRDLKKKLEKDWQIKMERARFIANFDYDYGDDKLKQQNQELFKIRKHIKPTKSPLFYEPEISDIHNENLNNPSLIPYTTLLKNENDYIKRTLDEQNILNSVTPYYPRPKTKSPSWMPSDKPKDLNEEFRKYIDESNDVFIKNLKEKE